MPEVKNDPFAPQENPQTVAKAPAKAPASTGKSEGKVEEKKETKTPTKRDNQVKNAVPNMAQDGKKFDLDLDADPPAMFPLPDAYSSVDGYMPDEMDFTDLSELNRAINHARRRAFMIKNEITNARRVELEVSDRYRKAYSRAYIMKSGGTADHRKSWAEIETEEIYSEMMVAKHVVEEIKNLSYTVSRDLDVLKTISDNLRKQLSL